MGMLSDIGKALAGQEAKTAKQKEEEIKAARARMKERSKNAGTGFVRGGKQLKDLEED